MKHIKKFENFDPMGSWNPNQLSNSDRQTNVDPRIPNVGGKPLNSEDPFGSWDPKQLNDNPIQKLLDKLPANFEVLNQDEKSCTIVVNEFRHYNFNITAVSEKYEVVLVEGLVRDNKESKLGILDFEETIEIIYEYYDLE